jgi:methyl-accepting chemotaxis protein
MRNLTGTLKSLAKTQGALGKAARDAAVQVEWISTSSADTISRANAISGATLHLSEGIREIGQRAANASHSAETGASSLEKAGAGLETACAVSLRCEQELAAMLTVVADLNTAILGVSGEAAATSGNTLAFVRAAGSANDMAQQAVAEIEVLRDLVSTTARTIDESRDMFGHVGQQAGEIVVAVAEQGAATREIATSLAAAADALQGLTQSVEALKTSFAGANGATDEFITIAYRMVEDARSIDNGVRSFLQDAVA